MNRGDKNCGISCGIGCEGLSSGLPTGTQSNSSVSLGTYLARGEAHSSRPLSHNDVLGRGVGWSAEHVRECLLGREFEC
jgi:hypothetical protein